MSTLKVIFDFILSVVKVIFPGKRDGRHCHPDHTVPHTHRPDRPAPEGDGGSTGGSGGDPVDGEAGEEEPRGGTDLDGEKRNTAPTASLLPQKLTGQALIAVAIIGYLYKMFLATAAT